MDSRIEKWRSHEIYFGTSSWKYEGWKGSVYLRDYPSDKKFKDECLIEYAEHYPTVGVDHTYYAWPSPNGFQKYVDQTPDNFRFGLKVTEKLTVWQYPKLPRYGKDAGTLNSSFLDPVLFKENFLDVLAPFHSRLGPLMLEFSQFYPGTISSGSEFTERLDKFFTDLSQISEQRFQFGIEIRNSNWLKPPYFEMLVRHGVAHVFNSWTRMPDLGEQLAATSGFDFPCYLARLLLRPGRKYEQAVEAFSPYDCIQDEQPELRSHAATLIKRARQCGRRAFVFVNNRCEGSAPLTINGILDELEKTKD